MIVNSLEDAATLEYHARSKKSSTHKFFLHSIIKFTTELKEIYYILIV